ncbi:helix-turn-helix domain-containing protein [Streptomyces sp. NPDC005438]|uniref:TetR/AcrR family transcriptional regulator n=1 Tax=Streptomyces sp. NPDC005438 TaxID=3156880 RepID=UPI0033B47704
MPRPALFTTEALLDAAVSLAARGGPNAVTMAALARETGAPSGSLYHRFTGRPALLAGVWLRAVEGFQEGCARSLRAHPSLEAAVDTARYVVDWSRQHPERARVLLYRPTDFDSGHWADTDLRRLRDGNVEVGALLGALAQRLHRSGESPDLALERLRLAVVDLPLALVRRGLLDEAGLLPRAAELAAESARRLLAPCRER